MSEQPRMLSYKQDLILLPASSYVKSCAPCTWGPNQMSVMYNISNRHIQNLVSYALNEALVNEKRM